MWSPPRCGRTGACSWSGATGMPPVIASQPPRTATAMAMASAAQASSRYRPLPERVPRGVTTAGRLEMSGIAVRYWDPAERAATPTPSSGRSGSRPRRDDCP